MHGDGHLVIHPGLSLLDVRLSLDVVVELEEVVKLHCTNIVVDSKLADVLSKLLNRHEDEAVVLVGYLRNLLFKLFDPSIFVISN